MQLAAVLIDILKHLKLVTPALAVRRTHLLQVLERVQGVAPLSSEQGAELRDLGVEGTRVVDCAQGRTVSRHEHSAPTQGQRWQGRPYLPLL